MSEFEHFYKNELYWDFRRLGLDENNPSVKRFVEKVYEEGYEEGVDDTEYRLAQ